MKEEKIIIYTDGSARGNPGPAGRASIILIGKEKFEIGGRAEKATNNQMELSSPIGALKYIKKQRLARTVLASDVLASDIEIFSDSKYVILGITEWIFNWQKNNWKNAAKKPVVNRELWEELYKLIQELKPEWTYVKGHNDHEHNDRADEIATSFADNEPVKLKKSMRF